MLYIALPVMTHTAYLIVLVSDQSRKGKLGLEIVCDRNHRESPIVHRPTLKQ